MPRLAALEVLKAVRVDDAYANLALPSVIRHYRLEPRDAAFATELVSGTLRRRGTYDAVLSACIDRSLNKVEARVLDALRLGTHQLLSMRVPAHAAISTTVDLVQARASAGAAAFTNAVLRKVDQHDLDGWLSTIATGPAGSSARLSIEYSHPRWVVDELRRAIGPEELPALLEADNVSPKVTLVTRPGRAEQADLPGEPTSYSRFGSVLEGGNPAAVPVVAEGRAAVQDEGSQLVAQLLADAPLEGRDSLWVDLCSGPGGKAALLAGVAGQRGARLLAIERQLHRAGLVRKALAGEPAALGVVTADGVEPPLRFAGADRILVDAPCTGLGALRRRPEARWRRRPDDLLGLVLLQRKLLDSALDCVRPGGLVLYATCSPVTSETSDVVETMLRQRSDVELVDAVPLLGVPDSAGRVPGTIQLWPHRHGTDAMYMALFRRRRE